MKMLKYILTFLAINLSVFCNSQSLSSYIQEAKENNPGLKSIYLEFEASLLRIPQVGALPDPNISFGYFISPVETRVGPQNAKFSLTQMFPWFGSLQLSEDKAALLAESKYQLFRQSENELVKDVKIAYFSLMELESHLEIENDYLKLLETYKTLATTSFSNSKGTMVDVIRVDIRIEDIKTEILVLENKLPSLEIEFNRLLSRPESEHVLIDKLEFNKLDFDYADDSLSLDHPLLLSIERKIESQLINVELQNKLNKPKIGLGLDYVIVGKRSDVDISDNGRDILMPMITLSIPFNKKANKAAVEEVQLLQSSLEYKKIDLESVLISSYQIVKYDIKNLELKFDLLKSKQSKTNQIAELLYVDYANSGKDFEELLRTQLDLLKYELMISTTIKEYYIALAKLDYITAKTQ